MSLNEKFGRGSSSLRKVEIHDVPDVAMLQKLFSDLSVASPGTECEISWQSGQNTFILSLGYSRQTARADWKLYLSRGLQPRLLWEYTTNDVSILHQLVLTELQKQLRTTQSMNALPALRGPAAAPEERRAVNINSNLSGKLRQLFIGAQEDLVAEASPPPARAVKPQLSTKSAVEYVDLSAGRQLLQNLFVNKFGIFSYPTFLFFLEREYYESVENNSPITLVFFKAITTAAAQGSDISLSPPLLQGITKTILYTQRKTDIFSQSQENKFAVLLTDTNASGAKSFISRVQKALAKIASGPGGVGTSVKFTFGLATLGEHCKTLPELLYFAEKSLTSAEQRGKDMVSDQDILSEPLEDKQLYLSQSIDLRPTRYLVSQLVSAGIFTYQAFLGFLEHEYDRSTRKKRDLLVLLLKVRLREETYDRAANLLPDQAFYEVIRRVGILLTKRDVFAHYSNGNFVIMRSNAAIAQMQNFAKRVVQSITSDQWLTPECPSTALRVRAQICAVRQHETSSSLLGFVPVD